MVVYYDGNFHYGEQQGKFGGNNDGHLSWHRNCEVVFVMLTMVCLKDVHIGYVWYV